MGHFSLFSWFSGELVFYNGVSGGLWYGEELSMGLLTNQSRIPENETSFYFVSISHMIFYYVDDLLCKKPPYIRHRVNKNQRISCNTSWRVFYARVIYTRKNNLSSFFFIGLSNTILLNDNTLPLIKGKYIDEVLFLLCLLPPYVYILSERREKRVVDDWRCCYFLKILPFNFNFPCTVRGL